MGRIFWGLIFMAIGLWIWLGNLNVIHFKLNFSRDWPVIIVIIGLLITFEGIRMIITRRRR